MTANNNRKYISEVWLDNGEDEEFKKSFLKSLLRQQQGHTNGFDADKIDGKHLYEIEEEIAEAIKYFITSFEIGETTISKGGIQYYLGFEAIKLYNTEQTDGIKDDQKKLPWVDAPYSEENLYSEDEIVPNLHDVICDLYKQTYCYDAQGRTNREVFKDFQEQLEETETDLYSLQESVGDKISEDGQLNADSVNGIRFFIYNNEQYATIKQKAEDYENGIDTSSENKKEYDKIHSINNVFIIRDIEDMRSEDNPDGIYTGNPDVAVINKYYMFRVDTVRKMLQYKYQDETNWHDICSTSDFLDNEAIQQKIADIIGTNSGYTINPSILLNSLELMDIDSNEFDTSSMPLASYNRERYLRGGIYNCDNNDCSENIPLEIKTIDNFQYLNLTPLQNTLSDQLNEYKIRLEGDNGQQGILGQMKNQITNNQLQINAIKGGSNKSIKDLDDVISSTKAIAENNQTQINNILGKWETYCFPELTYTDPTTKITYPSHIRCNPYLNLAVFYFSFIHYGSVSTDWVSRQVYNSKTKTTTAIGHRIPPDSIFTPYSNVVFNCVNTPPAYVRLTPEGYLYVRTSPKYENKNIHLVGHGVYRTKSGDFGC